MAGRFSRSWSLVQASADVLKSDKSLLLFPLASLICSVLVMASFAVPVLALLASHGAQPIHGRSLSVGGYAVLFLFYLSQYFVMFFFNTALAGAALAHMRGEPANFAAGLAVARSRWVSIFGYALIAATVGLLLRALQERLGLIGRLVVGFLGFAWSVATFLVVPVLASQNVGPMDAIEESSALLKRTWGENLIGTTGIGMAFGVLMLGVMLVAAVLVGGAVALQSPALIAVAVIAVVVGVLLLMLVQASLHGVYAAALYRYAESGEVGHGFDQALLQQAFAPKRK